MGLLIFFFVLSILFSFLCSIWEAVLLSITPSFINRQVQEGSSLGHDLEVFKEDIDRPLSAILTLNTIAHTVGAIGVGAQAANVFGSDSDFFGIPSETIIASVMTLAILILSEIIPKTIGANMWQSLAGFTVKSLKFLLKEKNFLYRIGIVTILKDGSLRLSSAQKNKNIPDIIANVRSEEQASSIIKSVEKILRDIENRSEVAEVLDMRFAGKAIVR